MASNRKLSGELSVQSEVIVLYAKHHPDDLEDRPAAFEGRILAEWLEDRPKSITPFEDPTTHILWYPGLWVADSNWHEPSRGHGAWLQEGMPQKVNKRRGHVLLCMAQTVIDSTGYWADYHRDGCVVWMEGDLKPLV